MARLGAGIALLAEVLLLLAVVLLPLVMLWLVVLLAPLLAPPGVLLGEQPSLELFWCRLKDEALDRDCDEEEDDS